MIEITQADRVAAIGGYYAWCSGNPVIPNKIASGVMDDHSMVQAFARHRLAERAKIVAWLTREEEDYPAGNYSGFAAMIREEIEAGEHLK